MAPSTSPDDAAAASSSAASAAPAADQHQPHVQLSRTCQTCFRAKIRCDRSQKNGACDRCRRLSKHCVFPPSRRRYNASSSKRDSRIEALEAKLDQLLNTRGEGSGGGGVPAQLPLPQAAYPEADRAPPSESSTTGPAEDVVGSGLLSVEKAHLLVETYKSALTPHFPFVVVPPRVAAQQLREEKPFMFLAVVCAACADDMPTQRKLAHRFKQDINDRILLGGGKMTFEVLQGLLVFLAWSQYHPRPRRYTQYLQLAVSIIIDLRLDRKPCRQWRTNVGTSSNPEADGTPNGTWGPDEQRAVAGCFYLSSSVSTLIQKTNTFPYTTYIEECCHSLAQRGEYRTDTLIKDAVRLQHIIEMADAISTHSNHEPSAKATLAHLRTELDTYKNSASFKLSESPLAVMLFHTAELFLCQAAFFDWSLEPATAMPLDTLRTGLTAAAAFFDFYMSLPLRAETAFNNTEWIQASFALTVAARLAVASTERSVSQETRGLRQALGMSNVLRTILLRIGALVTPQVDDRGDRDVFCNYEQRLRRIKDWFEQYSTPARKDQLDQYYGRSASRENDALAVGQQQEDPPTAYQQQPIVDATTTAGLTAPTGYAANSADAGTAWPAPLDEGQFDFQMLDFFPGGTIDLTLSDWFPQHMPDS